jgi:hypothetical protein
MRTPFSSIGRFANVAGGAVESDHFKAGVTLVARMDGSEAHGQPVRIGGAGGIGDEAEALHVLHKRLAGFHARKVREQRVRDQLATLGEVVIFGALGVGPSVLAPNHGFHGSGRRWLRGGWLGRASRQDE